MRDPLTNVIHSGRSRLVWPDWAKALGILLVVYGHSLGVPDTGIRVIYAFHVPLFFFLSGLLYRPKISGLGFWGIVKRQSGRLLIPYFAVGIPGALLWWMFLRKHGVDAGGPSSLHEAVLYLVYGSGKFGLIQPPAIWFLPCLFVSQIVFELLFQISRGPALVFTTILGTLLGFLLNDWYPRGLPFGFDIACMSLSFFGAGYSLHAFKDRLTTVNLWGRLVFFATSAAILLWCSLANGRVDMMRGSTGGSAILFIAAAFGGISAIVWLASLLPAWQPARLIAERSGDIFALHIYIFSFLSAVYVFVFHWPLEIKRIPEVAIIATVIALITTTYVVSPIWNYCMIKFRLRTIKEP